MAGHDNMSIVGHGQNQNKKKSFMHLTFPNDRKSSDSSIGTAEFSTSKMSPMKSPISLNVAKPSFSQRSIGNTTSGTEFSPASECSDSSLPSPPPPLPPKQKHVDRMGTGHAKSRVPNFGSKIKPVIDNGTLNLPLERTKTSTREGLSLKLNSPLSGGSQAACTTNTPHSRWSSSNSTDLNTKDHFNLKGPKTYSTPGMCLSPSSKSTSSSSKPDVDTSFQDPSTREQKKRQLVLHLPPSGASHYSHHHHNHHHNHHHHHGHHRHLHLGSHRRLPRGFYHNIQLSGKLNISPDLQVDFTADDLHDLGEIGRGGFGTVNKMVHRKTNTIMAVKRIRLTVDENEQKQLRDLEVAMWSNDCPFIVQFYGATLKEGDCWICMELMDTSLDKFYKFVYEKLNDCIPETILGKVTVATLTALNYLKEKLKLIHRDVKPSNILLDRRGNIKLCDFGISGHLVDSIAKTRDAGCRPYMAPERIDPAQARGYDVRSDVWSLGITLMELATGSFPYPKWNSVFEQLTQVVQGEPPRLKLTENGNTFTEEFVNFVNTCLTKEESARPKYRQLLDHSFVKKSNEDKTNVAQYVCRILDKMENNGKFMYTYNSYNY